VISRVMGTRGSRARISLRLGDLKTDILSRILGDEERTVENRFVLSNLSLPKGRILDIGCCDSLLSYRLAKAGYEVHCIDTRPYFETHPNMSFYHADIGNAPFPAEYFDRIISVSTVEHIGMGAYGDPIYDRGDETAISQMTRMARRDGKILLTVPYARRHTIARWLKGYERHYDSETLAKLLRKLKILKLELYSPHRRLAGFRFDWKRISQDDVEKECYKPAHTHAVACLVLAKLDDA